MIFVELNLGQKLKQVGQSDAWKQALERTNRRNDQLVLMCTNYYENVYLNRLTEWFKRRIGEKESLPEIKPARWTSTTLD